MNRSDSPIEPIPSASPHSSNSKEEKQKRLVRALELLATLVAIATFYFMFKTCRLEDRELLDKTWAYWTIHAADGNYLLKARASDIMLVKATFSLPDAFGREHRDEWDKAGELINNDGIVIGASKMLAAASSEFDACCKEERNRLYQPIREKGGKGRAFELVAPLLISSDYQTGNNDVRDKTIYKITFRFTPRSDSTTEWDCSMAELTRVERAANQESGMARINELWTKGGL